MQELVRKGRGRLVILHVSIDAFCSNRKSFNVQVAGYITNLGSSQALSLKLYPLSVKIGGAIGCAGSDVSG